VHVVHSKIAYDCVKDVISTAESFITSFRFKITLPDISLTNLHLHLVSYPH